MSDRLPRDRREERGVVMVLVALAMTALLLFGALAIDVGGVWASRTQSQSADDAAALAAAQAMITGDGMVDLDGAREAGQDVADKNSTLANPATGGTGGIQLRDEDFEFGFWNLDDRTLNTGVDTMDPDNVTGVRVTVVMDGAVNNRSPSFFSRLLGQNGFNVTSQAVAYRGFQGSFTEGEFDLPIAISSCVLSDAVDHCGGDFCEKIQTPYNPYTLDDPQDANGDGVEDPGAMFTALEFSGTNDQTGCWTAFDPTNTPAQRVRGLISSGNSPEVAAGNRIDLSNGEINNAVDRVSDEFDDHARNRYAGGGSRDSWVVKLPVVECQEDDHCAGGGSVLITGAVCFEIREVTSSPNLIKGRFLCPNTTDTQVLDLYDEYCRDVSEGGGAPGGCNYGLHADKVVLVQ